MRRIRAVERHFVPSGALTLFHDPRGNECSAMGDCAVIVIGASMGGVDALQRLVEGLPPDIPAALFVVQHIGRHASTLPTLLAYRGRLPAVHGAQGSAVRPGHIYVAPPDHHLLVERGIMRLTRGPRENWARPAIDPLFRSAAVSYGPRVIGVVLTGMLNDGSAGLRAVRAAGGIAVVQDPHDAVAPDMPWSALRHAGADFRVPLRAMPELLTKLAAELADNNAAGLRIEGGGRSNE
jgi:two-component system chemotaxis response regulator CheB